MFCPNSGSMVLFCLHIFPVHRNDKLAIVFVHRLCSFVHSLLLLVLPRSIRPIHTCWHATRANVRAYRNAAVTCWATGGLMVDTLKARSRRPRGAGSTFFLSTGEFVP